MTVTRVNQTGGTAYPAADSTGGWEMEESLDVEWAHAIAPGAKIMLVEARSANDSDLLAAVDYAAAQANVVSLSWGGGEFSGESTYDAHFSTRASRSWRRPATTGRRSPGRPPRPTCWRSAARP